MRYFKFMAALSLGLTLLASCGKDDEKKEDYVPQTLQFISYAFTQAGNPALDSNYVLSNVTNSVVIRMPEALDKSALVAEFTLGTNQAAYVGGVKQVSGVTANDFSAPVDYVITDTVSATSIRVTIEIRKILVKKWFSVAAVEPSALGKDVAKVMDYYMAVSPKTGLPSFIAAVSNADGTLYGSAYGEYADGSVKVGAGMITDSEGVSIQGKYPRLAFDADGRAYVSYYNSAAYKNTVITGSGSSWTKLGDVFGGVRSGIYVALGIDPSTKYPVYAYMANSKGGNLARRDLSLNYYDGSAWQADNTISDFAGSYTMCPVMKTYGGTLYLAGVIQNKTKTYFVTKYAGGKAWQTLVNNRPEGVSQSAIYDVDFAVASDGTVYLLAGGDEDQASSWKMNVYKFKEGDANFTRVGSALPFAASNNGVEAIFLINDHPAIAYYDTGSSTADHSLKFISFDPETMAWSEPASIDAKAAGDGLGSVYAATDPDGNVWVSFQDENDVIRLYEYKMDAD